MRLFCEQERPFEVRAPRSTAGDLTGGLAGWLTEISSKQQAFLWLLLISRVQSSCTMIIAKKCFASLGVVLVSRSVTWKYIYSLSGGGGKKKEEVNVGLWILGALLTTSWTLSSERRNSYHSNATHALRARSRALMRDRKTRGVSSRIWLWIFPAKKNKRDYCLWRRVEKNILKINVLARGE